mmetsp:Transcript_2749/g.9475  ORF Transcript_2749/g.9475 Transcript_2749/m.9475 type:complete len:384 (+) Transcript_2749:32-1183(+)
MNKQWKTSWPSENCGLGDERGDHVRVHVAGGPPVLEVALALPLHIPADPNACPPVRKAPGEGVNGSGLVRPGEPPLVALSVGLDVLVVLGLQLADRLLDHLQTAVRAHGRRGVVAMGARAVPVAGDGLGVERDNDVGHLADPLQQVAGDPHLVARGDSLARADLVLPLRGHDLAVGARDLQPRVQARLEVSVADLPTGNLVGAHRAVVRTLGAGESLLGPPQGPVGLGVQQGVLLLDSVPRHLTVDLGVREDLGGVRAGVRGQRVSVRVLALAHAQQVLAAAERVAVDGARDENHLGVLAGRLARAASVKVPLAELVHARHLLADRPGLGPAVLHRAVDPDVLHDGRVLRGGHLQKLLDARRAVVAAAHPETLNSVANGSHDG